MSGRKFRRVGRIVAGSLLVFTIALLTMLGTEVCLRGVRKLEMWFADRQPGCGDYRVMADVYQDRSWAESYYREFHQTLEFIWKPYLYWRHKTVQGKWIGVDEEGFRRTIEPPLKNIPARKEKKKVVAMFGGSALWGWGVDDQGTIPSQTAQILAKSDRYFEVRNYAEIAYVARQEAISLIHLLEEGFRPDFVVIYDGFNDVFSSIQNEQAGLTQNEMERSDDFGLAKKPFRPQGELLRMFSASGYYAGRIVLFFADPPFPERFRLQPIQSDQQKRLIGSNDKLAEETVRIYRGVIDLFERIAVSYGFSLIVCWQPTIFTKNHLTTYEAFERDRVVSYAAFFAKVGQLLEKHPPQPKSGVFRNLSSLFNNLDDPVFIDYVHTSERGNHLIAQEIANEINRMSE